MLSEGIEVEAEVSEMVKNATAIIRGRLTVLRGTPCLDVRVFAHGGGAGLVPTRAGIALSRERAEDFRALVAELCDAAKASTQDTREEVER